MKDLAAAHRRTRCSPAWAGLGYYARARNLHAAAKLVANTMGGRFPERPKRCAPCRAWAAIHSGAIAAIAYDERQAAMDANAERVIARLYAVETPMPESQAANCTRIARRWCRNAPAISRRR